MSDAPERIWASLSDERFNDVAFHGGWSALTTEYHTYEYVRADRIEELMADRDKLRRELRRLGVEKFDG